MKAASHMSRFADPRAPIAASPEEAEKIKTNPKLAQLVYLRDSLSMEVKHESGTIAKAKLAGTKLYQLYNNANRQVCSTRSYLHKLAKAKTRNDFFDTINTMEINSQLNDPHSLLDLDQDSWQPQPSYRLEERKMVAELICANTATLDDDTRLRHRICTTNALVELGRKREFRPGKASAREPASIKRFSFPNRCSRVQCFFCFWDKDLTNAERLREFSTKYKTRNHVISHHLRHAGKKSIPCPEASCKEAAVQLENVAAFQSHVTRDHGYDIFNRYKIG